VYGHIYIDSSVTCVLMRSASATQSQYSNQQVNTAMLWAQVTVKEMDQNTTEWRCT